MKIVQIKHHPVLDILVSSDGAVFSPGRGKVGLRWTRGAVSTDGYLRVGIHGKSYSMHRLVAETFLPNESGLQTVDHIDRNRANNDVSNLRWASYTTQARNTDSFDRCAEKYGIHSFEDRSEWQRRYRNTPEGRARISKYNRKAREMRKGVIKCA